MNVETLRNKKVLGLLMICALVVASPSFLNIIPGPEGVVCSLYGAMANGSVQFQHMDQAILSEGLHTMSRIGEVNPSDWIAYRQATDFYAYGYRWIRPDPYTPIIAAGGISEGREVFGINLETRISRPTFDEINRHGDPIGTRSPTQIDWYSYNGERTETETQTQTATEVITQTEVEWKHYEVNVVPVDFIVELSVRPRKTEEWGAFKDLDLWLVIDTNVWYNAFTQSQMLEIRDKPSENVTVSAYDFRGAFPIWAWVGEWDPWVVTGRDNDPEKEYDKGDLTSEEFAELQPYLDVMPSFGGSEVTLYTEPDWLYDRLFSQELVSNPDRLEEVLGSEISGLPDSRFALTVYTPITLTKFGALKRWGGIYPFTNWKKFYYPTAYLRVRALYAVWGEWVYMWTKEEAQRLDYEFENRSSIVISHESGWDQFLGSFGNIGDWFTNPFNQLWLIFGTLIIVLVAITILNPGLWGSLAVAYKSSKSSRGKSKKWK